MRGIAILGLALIAVMPLLGEEEAELDLEACLKAVSESGPDIAALRRSLDLARAQYDLAAAKAAPILKASASAEGNDGLGDVAAIRTAGGSLGLGLGGSGATSLSLSTPLSSLSLSAGQTLPASVSSSNPTTTVELGLKQTLWDGYPGGSLRATVDKALLTLRGKELAAAQTRSQALAAAKQAYVALLNAQRSLELKHNLLEQQRKVLAQVRAIYAIKQATAVELKTAELNEKSAEIDLKAAEKDLGSARRKLVLLMGLPADASFRVAELEPPSLPVASLEEALAAGRAHRNDTEEVELLRRSAAIDLALARGQAKPSLSLQGGLGMAFQKGDSPADATELSVGLSLGLPILDGGGLAAQERASGAQLEAYEAQIKQLERTRDAEIAEAYEAALIQEERVRLAEEQAGLAEAKLSLVEAQYTYGAASLQDRFDAQTLVANAENSRLKAAGDYLLAAIALETAMGL